ncbi:unnamed protein product [Mytilus coruscus]|uniref:CD80-like immunoglobulin C2-set domain-containing protein n=1 Tax=Mytilus coruscus TaxID=42192 RepID=A0A6J8CL04_MYTCO|nr:unnamed protein product [Mytilus coruscus]
MSYCAISVSNGQNLITLNAEKDFVLVGDSPKYVCTVYQTAEFLIENPLNWEKRGRDGSKLVISVLANVEEGLASEFELQLATTDNSISFTLSFLEGIKEEYDGYFACVLYKRWNATVLTEKKVDVHVIKTIKKTEFVIADHLQTADGKPDFAIRLEEGTYNPICKTEGSNPPAVVKIYLGNTELMGYPKVEVQNTSSNQPQRVYNVEKRVTIRLDINDNNKILKCVVQVIADTKCIMRAEMLYQLKVLNSKYQTVRLYLY